MRAQQNGGDPKLRYCANLGHRQDDETGMVYMRARYYDPYMGRFISEDPARDGTNWFAYCGNNPMSKVDQDGQSDFLVTLLQLAQSLLQGVGLKILASAALKMSASALAARLEIVALRLATAGNINIAEASALARLSDNPMAGLAASMQGKLGAKQLSTALTLKSMAQWLRYLGDSGDGGGGDWYEGGGGDIIPGDPFIA